MKVRKICFVVASPYSALSFLKDHIKALSAKYDVYLVANEEIKWVVDSLNIKKFKCIHIERNINIKSDIKAVLDLHHFFKEEKFDVVHSVTPKAGLITSLAAYWTNIPHRIHIFTGQVWATRHGFMRYLLKWIDRIIVKLDNHILVDGEGQRQFLIRNHIVSEENSVVLGDGSICGVNTNNFIPDKNVKNRVLKGLRIPNEKVVFMFMGRLNRDKGIRELLTAYDRICENYKNTFLVLFGNDEGNFQSTFTQYGNIKNQKNFLYYGLTDKPYEMLQAADVFVLPTYREGFGLSVIEASCLGRPVICSDAYGVMDAMVDNKTGLRCRVADVDSLYQCMEKLLQNSNLRLELGYNGRERVLKYFSNERLTKLWVDFYQTLLMS